VSASWHRSASRVSVAQVRLARLRCAILDESGRWQVEQVSEDRSSSYPYDLGAFSRPIGTSSPEAQVWFDRGLNWCYGFNHDEAIRCFERAALADPDCAMAKWGIAYAAGCNYNKPWEAFLDGERA